jgi:hypothetical protein
MLFDDERKFFEKLIAEQSVCSCFVSKGLLQDFFERAGTELANLFPCSMIGNMARIQCPTTVHCFLLASRPAYSLSVVAISNRVWWGNDSSKLTEACLYNGAEFELATRKFHNAIS